MPYYFGCWNGTGHYLHTPDGRWPRDKGPFSPARLDGSFCPTGHQDEGVAKLTHDEGWTVLAFWDRSVDKRGGSHSTFLFEGKVDFQEAVEQARRHFPAVTARYTFIIREG